MEFLEILKLVDDMNIDPEHGLTYKAALIMLYAMLNENWMSYAVIEASRQQKICKITFTDTLRVQRNLRKNGILVNGQLGMESADTPGSLEWIIEFTLMAMAGAGVIRRYEIPNETKEEKKI